MQSKNNAPNTKQLLFREIVRSQGCIICGHPWAEIHHVVGCAGRENKQKIGHWFLLPLCAEHHRIGAVNVTNWTKKFTEAFGTQRSLFIQVCEKYRVAVNDELPFSEEIYQAIQMTRK